MRGTGIEMGVEIFATNLTNKTKYMSTNEMKRKKLRRHVVSTLTLKTETL
jgi:hypothetical protein